LTNRQTNSSAVREQKITVENEIRELRTKINDHLDKLQKNLMKELTETEKRIADETRELLKVLIQQLHRQTLECWWLLSSEQCLSCMIVLFDLDYRC
jgi:uncharacterized protein involved in exopolysaccharide biosynthesis